MKYRLDESQFDRVQTVYEFAQDYVECHNIEEPIASVKVEANDAGYREVVIRLKNAAPRRLGLDEVCEFMDVNYVLLGTYADNRTWVICGVGIN